MINEQFGWFVLLSGLLSLGLLLGLPAYPLFCRLHKRQPRRHWLLSLLPLLAVSLFLTYYCAMNWKNSERLMPEGTVRTWAGKVYAAHAPDNFYRLGPELYRSAQPTSVQMQALEKMGIKSIINLRSLHSDEDEIASTGLRNFRIDSVATNIALEEVAAFLKVMSDPQNLPALVHCQHGSDRTGTMCAFYRILHDGWTREEAIAELTGGGYGFHYIYDRPILELIRTADLDRLRQLSGYPLHPTAVSGTPDKTAAP